MSRDLHSCPVLHAVSHTSHSSLHFVHMSRTSLSIQLRTLRSCPALLSRALHSRMLVSCILRWCSALIASVPHLTQLSRLFTCVRGLLLISRTSSSFPVLHSYFAFPFHTLHCACSVFCACTPRTSPLRLRFCARGFLAVKRDPYTL